MKGSTVQETNKKLKRLERENEELREKLREAEDVLHAIREGQVDAVIVSGTEGDHIFTLQGAEHPYRLLIEQMQEGAVTVVLDGTIYYANAAFAKMLDRPLEELIGSRVHDHVAPEYLPQFELLLKQAESGSARGELQLIRGNALLLPVYIGVTPVVTEAGSSLCMVVADLTEQKRAEQILASEQQARAILNQAADGIVVCDAEGRVIFANASARKHLIQAERFPALRGNVLAGEAFTPEGQPVPVEMWPLAEALNGITTTGQELRLLQKGEAFDLLVSAGPLLDAHGRIIGGVATFTDITGRKKIEQALRESEERFRVVQELSPDGFTILTPVRASGGEIVDFTWVFQNAAIARMNGTPEKAVIGRRLSEFLPGHDLTPFHEVYKHVAETGEIRILEAPYNVDASRNPVWFRVAVVRMGRDLAVLAQDITERKRLEGDLRAAMTSAERAKQTAEHANQAKDHFLATLSHELRTPLSPVMTAVQLIEREERLSPRVADLLEVIKRNLGLEASLIDDLLDLTRIVRGKVVLERKRISVPSVIQRVVDVCHEDIEARKLGLGLDIQGEVVVDADPSRLQQVFWNLLKNSIKFTPEGGRVAIKARSVGRRAVVEVADSGVGIDREALPSVFDAFEQGDSSVTRQFGGLGLGLAITKRLVELHGGSITAASPGKDQGAVFCVTLPLVDAEAEIEEEARGQQPAMRSSAAARILLVEDHGDTAATMSMLLESAGYTVDVAGGAEQALNAVSANGFDIMISDLGLPDRSGVELMKELRARGSHLKGIALSGYGREEDVKRSIESGFSAHLTKPVDFDVLLRTVASVTSS